MKEKLTKELKRQKRWAIIELVNGLANEGIGEGELNNLCWQMIVDLPLVEQDRIGKECKRFKIAQFKRGGSS